MNYLNWLRNRIILPLLLFWLLSCKTESQYDVLVNYLLNEHSYTLNENIQAIAVVSENGGCMNCNRSFSSFISTEINNPSVVFLVCSTGQRIDISPYINSQGAATVLLDQHDKFSETKILDGSGVIFIHQNIIDTIVKIDIETKDEGYIFIRNKLSK